MCGVFKLHIHKVSDIHIIHLDNFICEHVLLLFSPDLGNVRFSLNGTVYQNNSIVTLEDIGEGDAALLCLTDQTACCIHPTLADWFFPNGTGVPSPDSVER